MAKFKTPHFGPKWSKMDQPRGPTLASAWRALVCSATLFSMKNATSLTQSPPLSNNSESENIHGEMCANFQSTF